MEAVARQQFIRTSPRKIRIVANVVRGKNVQQAINTLHFMPQKAADLVESLIKSAVHNLIDQHRDERIDEEALVVTAIRVDEGPHIKRFRPASRGRAMPILKRSSHLTVTVGLPAAADAAEA